MTKTLILSIIQPNSYVSISSKHLSDVDLLYKFLQMIQSRTVLLFCYIVTMLLISCLIFRSHNLSLLIFHFFFQSTIPFHNQQNNSFHPFPNRLCSSYDNQKAPWHRMPQCLVNRLSIFTHEFYPQIDSIILSVILLYFYISLFY